MYNRDKEIWDIISVVQEIGQEVEVPNKLIF